MLSDGRFNKDNARRYIREAQEKRYLYIFVILDKAAQTSLPQKKQDARQPAGAT